MPFGPADDEAIIERGRDTLRVAPFVLPTLAAGTDGEFPLLFKSLVTDDTEPTSKGAGKLRLYSFNWVSMSAIALDGTNYATWKLIHYTLDGSGHVAQSRVLFTKSLTGGYGGLVVGSAPAYVSGPWALSDGTYDTGGDTYVEIDPYGAGDFLTFQVTHAGTGKILPASTLLVAYAEEAAKD